MKKFKLISNHQNVVWVLTLLLLAADLGSAKRIFSGGSRKSSPSRTSSRVTPSYSSRTSNSHADAAKLSYPNYNSQPNRPASAPASTSHGGAPAYGWNVPKQQGPPPAYSASNPVGGARTNVNERPPAYNAPPSYAASSNAHSPITATNMRNTQSAPPGATYHSPGNLPAGASYYPHGGVPAGATYHSPGNLPAGATYHSPGNLPAGATYHSPGNLPAGATYHPSGGYPAAGGYGGGAGGYHAPPAYGGGYHAPAGASYPQQLPAGATYVQPGAALPPGAVFMSQPPKSSGAGFGTGLIAGGLGGALTGALLTNALSSSHSHGMAAPAPGYAPAAAAGESGGDRIIIINNGQPVNVSEAGPGTTVINTGGAPQGPAAAAGAPAPGVAPVDNGAAPLAPMAPLAPLAPLAADAAPVSTSQTSSSAPNADATPAPNADAPPAPGGIICVPVRVNETDPNDSTKMIEVEKIACYPAPPPEAPAPAPVAATETQAAPQQTPAPSSDSSQVPLAPLQTTATQSTLIGNEAMARSTASHFPESISFKMSLAFGTIWSFIYASRFMLH